MGMSLVAVIQMLMAQVAAFAALLLIASAGHKIVNWPQLQPVLRQLAGVPAPLTAPLLAGAVCGEVVAGVLLVVPPVRAGGALLATAIWSAYLVLILRAIFAGRHDIDCGCSFGAAKRPLGGFQAVRTAVLVVIALLVAVAAGRGDGLRIEGSQALGACALLALYLALDQAMALPPLRGGGLG